MRAPRRTSLPICCPPLQARKRAPTPGAGGGLHMRDRKICINVAVEGIDVGAEFAGHRLEAEIGRGGMGVVYRARDLALDRIVALKLIAPDFATDAEFRDRFKRESQLAASIRHPNVIAIHRAGEEDLPVAPKPSATAPKH